jgi:glycosyltransferase involved in cell wall biosynthesis
VPEAAAPDSIALDASLWDEPTTGIGLYARCLGGALEAHGIHVRKVGARTSGDAPRGELASTAFTIGKLPALLEDSSEPLFHAVGNFNLPLTRIAGKRLVLTVHDVIPLLLPQTVSAAYRWQFRVWLARSIRVADRIICVSERTRSDLVHRYPEAGKKAVVVHHGADHVDRVPPPDPKGEAFLRELRLPNEFVLYAGSLDARKNVGLLLDAAGRLKSAGRPITTVVVGQKWFGAEAAERGSAEAVADGNDVRVLDYLSDSLFYALMRKASVFVFPSLYEGFGLPPLEAMRLGVPVVCSNAGALPEVCGEAAAQVAPDDADGLAAALRRLLDSPDERRTRIAAGKRRAAGFTWDATARRTIDAYRSALTPNPSPASGRGE